MHDVKNSFDIIIGILLTAIMVGCSENRKSNNEQLEYAPSTKEIKTSTPALNMTAPQVSSSHLQMDYAGTTNSSSETPDDAYQEGYDNGYEAGMEDGENGEDEEYSYDSSSEYYDYYETRYEEGYNEGYYDGYEEGHSNYVKQNSEHEGEEEDEW